MRPLRRLTFRPVARRLLDPAFAFALRLRSRLIPPTHIQKLIDFAAQRFGLLFQLPGRIADLGRGSAGLPRHLPARSRAMRRLSAFAMIFLLMGCAGQFSEPPAPTQAEQLCTKWGYAPNDPVCLNAFHSTGGQ